MLRKLFIIMVLFGSSTSLFSQLNVHGELRIGYWPTESTNTPQISLHPNGKVKLYDWTSYYFGYDLTDNNGFYTMTWDGGYKHYYVQFYVATDFVKLYKWGGPYLSDEQVQKSYTFLPSGNRLLI